MKTLRSVVLILLSLSLLFCLCACTDGLDLFSKKGLPPARNVQTADTTSVRDTAAIPAAARATKIIETLRFFIENLP